MSLALRYSQALRDLLIITSNRDTYASWLKHTQIERAPLIMIIKNRTRVIIQWVFCVYMHSTNVVSYEYLIHYLVN